MRFPLWRLIVLVCISAVLLAVSRWLTVSLECSIKATAMFNLPILMGAVTWVMTGKFHHAEMTFGIGTLVVFLML